MHKFEDVNLNFLDIETTGLSYSHDRIIEIYACKVKNGQEISSYHTFVNPGFRPNPYITKLLNINYEQLKKSPTFEEIAQEIYDFLTDGILIAHNARFDYSFIKNQLKEYGLDINLNYCCTVKLSRHLYPNYQKHGLDQIISRINFQSGDRHRADYDTHAIKTFFYKALEEHGNEKFNYAYNKAIKEAAIPESLANLKIQDIPETPGVYFFYGQDNYPIYIGMSKHLRRRIQEHLYQDLTSSKELNIKQNVKRIDYIQTAGELGAAIRESILIKKYQPLYNIKLRRNSILVKLEQYLDEDGYLNVRFNEDPEFDLDNIENIIGVFKSKVDAKSMLENSVKELGLCPKLLGLEKGKGACFAFQLEKCKGACTKKITASDYNLLFNNAFKKFRMLKWPYPSELVVVESSGEISEEMHFDKWCLVKSSSTDIINDEFGKSSFNLDIYKILKRYLIKT